MKLILEPSEIESPIGKSCPFLGSLGRTEFEFIAADIVASSQVAGKWGSLQNPFNAEEASKMTKKGFLKKEGSVYTLTDLAKLRIFNKYPAKAQ